MEKLQITAHSLKGELGYMGLPDAADKARDLERMGQERSLQSAAGLFPTLQAEVSALAMAMRDMLDGRHDQ